MAGYTNIVYGGVTLTVINMTVSRVPATKKQKIGRALIKQNIIGLDTVDFSIDITGMITGDTLTDLETNRLAIDALDDCNYHALTTGFAAHEGNYIIEPNSLVWTDDSNDVQSVYRYSLKLIQYQQ